MNKTKIEYVDYTFNPVTGCLHGCEYCYARKIANRFGGASETHYNECVGEECQWCTEETGVIHDLTEPIYDVDRGHKAPYPFGFDPTFHKYRLSEPQQVKKPSKIFVVSMGDLFGDFIPDEWIEEVFKACEAAPQHKYLFLTKNPERFQDVFLIQRLNIKPNMWFGFSAADQRQLNKLAMGAKWLPVNSFVSIEPLHNQINLTKIEPDGVDAYLDFTTGKQYWFMGGDDKGKRLKWVIVGAETGNRRGKVIPKREWVESIVEQCKAAGVPVFMKNSLKNLMGDDFIQEWPESLQQIAR
jgi:protein gp37